MSKIIYHPLKRTHVHTHTHTREESLILFFPKRMSSVTFQTNLLYILFLKHTLHSQGQQKKIALGIS